MYSGTYFPCLEKKLRIQKDGCFNILVFQTFFMRIGSNVLSTKAQNQNIVVAHFSAYFSKMFSKLCQLFFLYQGENDVVQKFVLEDFSTEWIDIKKLVVVVVLVAVSLPNCWDGVDGEEDHFVNCFSWCFGGNGRPIVSAGLKIPKNAKISKLKERKKKLKYFKMMREGWFFLLLLYEEEIEVSYVLVIFSLA